MIKHVLLLFLNQYFGHLHTSNTKNRKHNNTCLRHIKPFPNHLGVIYKPGMMKSNPTFMQYSLQKTYGGWCCCCTVAINHSMVRRLPFLVLRMYHSSFFAFLKVNERNTEFICLKNCIYGMHGAKPALSDKLIVLI